MVIHRVFLHGGSLQSGEKGTPQPSASIQLEPVFAATRFCPHVTRAMSPSVDKGRGQPKARQSDRVPVSVAWLSVLSTRVFAVMAFLQAAHLSVEHVDDDGDTEEGENFDLVSCWLN